MVHCITYALQVELELFPHARVEFPCATHRPGGRRDDAWSEHHAVVVAEPPRHGDSAEKTPSD